MYGKNENVRGNKPPVQVGEVIEVTVEAKGDKGDGIAKVKGFVLFIPGASAGQRLKVKITKVHSKVGFAEKLEELEKPKQEPQEDFEEVLEQPAHSSSYEDTEDFGEDIEEKP